MSTRDWFEGIRYKVKALARMESDVEDARQRTGPRGQQFDSPGGRGAATDASAPILSLADMEADLDRLRAETNDEIERALDVLYGTSGRGGLAQARTSTDADCICGYYLMGMSWREVADEMVKPESRSAKDWCRMRACRAFAYMDRVGMDWLMDS